MRKSELKTVEQCMPIHNAQLLSYLRLAEKEVGLLINFHEVPLKNGVCRKIITRKSVPSS
ncbi:MAG: GxxExxY protein [Verrucomicrobia bacterium]|nr:GxxExxY protein [Verrucomicrobiota bacterium]MBU4247866.1 GxxExxY protein [Verrucomicrobiota bacterium]MBU4290861.1 GxxExxY protein [Verrucomicrobiota bacterium]MBU4496529.1 GxxExxY protein [Verrucomicrobiota bacterium]